MSIGFDAATAVRPSRADAKAKTRVVKAGKRRAWWQPVVVPAFGIDGCRILRAGLKRDLLPLGLDDVGIYTFNFDYALIGQGFAKRLGLRTLLGSGT